jgi:hypothetical protein
MSALRRKKNSESGLPDGIFSNKFGGPCKRRCWYILWTFGLFYGHWVYFMGFGEIFHVLVCCAKKNLATPFRVQETAKSRKEATNLLLLELVQLFVSRV